MPTWVCATCGPVPAGAIRHLDHDSPHGHETHECGSSAGLDWTKTKEHEMAATPTRYVPVELNGKVLCRFGATDGVSAHWLDPAELESYGPNTSYVQLYQIAYDTPTDDSGVHPDQWTGEGVMAMIAANPEPLAWYEQQPPAAS